MEEEPPTKRVKVGEQKQEVKYNVQHIKKASSFNKVDMVDNCLGIQGKLTCLPIMEKDYNHQKGLAGIKNSNTVNMRLFNKSTSSLLVEDVSFTLDHWLCKQLTTQIDADTELRHLCAREFIKNCETWWNRISSDFCSIFGPVVDGIRALHSAGKYHGNLKYGIVISVKKNQPPKGHISNTKDRSPKELEELQRADVKQLISLIDCVIRFPFSGTTCEPFIPPYIDSLCLKQLKDWNYHYSRLRKQWDLNPVIFWDEEQTIKLLYAVFWILFRDDTAFARSIAAGAFKNEDWHVRVEEKQNANMNAVLNDITCNGLNKLRFRRNCMQHMGSTDKEVSKNYSDRETTHRFLIKIIPELITETVDAMRILIAWLPDQQSDLDSLKPHEKVLLSKVKVMYKDMRWKWMY